MRSQEIKQSGFHEIYSSELVPLWFQETIFDAFDSNVDATRQYLSECYIKRNTDGTLRSAGDKDEDFWFNELELFYRRETPVSSYSSSPRRPSQSFAIPADEGIEQCVVSSFIEEHYVDIVEQCGGTANSVSFITWTREYSKMLAPIISETMCSSELLRYLTDLHLRMICLEDSDQPRKNSLDVETLQNLLFDHGVYHLPNAIEYGETEDDDTAYVAAVHHSMLIGKVAAHLRCRFPAILTKKEAYQRAHSMAKELDLDDDYDISSAHLLFCAIVQNDEALSNVYHEEDWASFNLTSAPIFESTSPTKLLHVVSDTVEVSSGLDEDDTKPFIGYSIATWPPKQYLAHWVPAPTPMRILPVCSKRHLVVSRPDFHTIAHCKNLLKYTRGTMNHGFNRDVGEQAAKTIAQEYSMVFDIGESGTSITPVGRNGHYNYHSDCAAVTVDLHHLPHREAHQVIRAWVEWLVKGHHQTKQVQMISGTGRNSNLGRSEAPPLLSLLIVEIASAVGSKSPKFGGIRWTFHPKHPGIVIISKNLATSKHCEMGGSQRDGKTKSRRWQ